MSYSKIASAAALSSLLTILPAYAESSATSEKPTTGSPSMCYEPAVLELKNGNGCLVLSKQFDKTPGPRIILAVTSDRRYLLNPQENLYPQSEDLKKVTIERAQELFGDAQVGLDGIRRFTLMLARDSREQGRYYVDAKFTNGKLNSYKIQAQGIPTQQWMQVE